METLEGQPRLAYPRERQRHLLGIDAELLRSAAHLHARGLELEIGVHPDRDARGTALAPRKLGKQSDLAERFDVDEDAGSDGLRELDLGLAGSGEADVLRIRPRVECDAQLATRRNVETVDAAGHVGHQCRHRVGLDRVMHVDRRRDRIAQLGHARVERTAVIGIEGRAADACGETGQRHAANHQFPVFDGELRHRGVRLHAHMRPWIRWARSHSSRLIRIHTSSP